MTHPEVDPHLLQAQLYYNQSCLFGFECEYDEKLSKANMKKYYYVCFLTSGFYFVLIFALKEVMKSRKALDLRWLLFLWNLGLSMFSILGAVRFLPEMIHVVTQMGFYYSVCSPSYASNKVSGVWAVIFTLSKIVELFDTVFIVLRKRKLIFLHWYHHITVHMYTWLGAPYSVGPARCFIGINYLVHAMMYPYYTLTTCGLKFPKAVSICITTAQILQMFFGVYVSVYAVAMILRGTPCHFPSNHVTFGLIMYLSFLVLFGNFFCKTYLTFKNKAKKVD